MLKRYPHIGRLVLKSLTSGLDTGIVGEDSVKEDSIEIRGRFSNKSGFDNRYTAKFYCDNDSYLRYRDQDDAQLRFEWGEFNVVRVLPGQTHTELWLS